MESLGAAFSSLCGEQLAEVVNYSFAFGVLSVVAILPIVIYGCYMPSGTRDVFTGEMVELLSVIDHYPPSPSCLPYARESTSIDCSVSSSVDIDSSQTRLSTSYARHPQLPKQHQVDEESRLSESLQQGQESRVFNSEDADISCSTHTTTRHIRDSLSEM